MRIREPRCTALIFRSGKLVCTGARNDYDANLGTRKFARILQKLNYPVKFMEFKIQNLVATVDLRFPIRLENLNQMHGQFSSYEPELFPGLIYRMVKPRVVLLIFVNGKIVFTGAKSKPEISESLEKYLSSFTEFQKELNLGYVNDNLLYIQRCARLILRASLYTSYTIGGNAMET